MDITTINPITGAAENLGDGARGVAVTRGLLAGVAFAAGLIGVAMLAAPESTGTYFSWRLGPPALAAQVGAFYVVSCVVFGWAALREQWAGQRGLCVAVLGLAGPTVVATARHRDVFDFDRWQAVAWVVLFVASFTSFGSLLVRRGRDRVADSRPRLGSGPRVILVALGAAYTVVAVVLWSSPDAVSDHGPLVAGPLGLRFVGSWAAMLAIAAVYAVTHPDTQESRLPVAALVGYPLASSGAALVHLDEFRSGGPTVAFVSVVAVLSAAAVAVAVSGWRVRAH